MYSIIRVDNIQVDHNNITNNGEVPHIELDSHVRSTTFDPHAGQDLRITATPTFAGLNVTGIPTSAYHVANKAYVDTLIGEASSRVLDHNDLTSKGVLTHSQIDSKIGALETKVIDHADLTSKGFLTHPQIDTSISSLMSRTFATEGEIIRLDNRITTEAAKVIDHNDLSNKGNLTHWQIDSKITALEIGATAHANGVLTHEEIDEHIGNLEARVIDHGVLTSIGTLTHNQIDAHINSPTDPHAQQDLKWTASPTWKSVNIIDAPTEPTHATPKSYVDAGLSRTVDHSELSGTGYLTHPFIDSKIAALESKVIDHSELTSKGVLTHDQIDTRIHDLIHKITDHSELSGIGVKDHYDIDDHLGMTTYDPHAGQDLRETAVPTFASVKVTAAPTLNSHLSNKGYVDGAVSGLTSDHGSLSGLTDDDHSQYFMVNGRVGDPLKVTNTTEATSTSTGALTVAGGIAALGRGNFGGELGAPNLSIAGSGATIKNGFSLSTPSGLQIERPGNYPQLTITNYDGENGLQIYAKRTTVDPVGCVELTVRGQGTAPTIVFTASTDSTTKDNGGVAVRGGLGVNKALNVGNAITSGATVTGMRFTANTPSTTSTTVGDFLAPNLTADGQTLNMYMGQHFSSDNMFQIAYQRYGTGDNQGNNCFMGMYGGSKLEFKRLGLKFNSASDSTSTTSGAFQLLGGMGMAKSLTVGLRATATNMTCLTAPTLNTDVVRKADLTPYETATMVVKFYQNGLPTNPSNNVYVTLVRTGACVTCRVSEVVLPADVTGLNVALLCGTEIPVNFRPANLTIHPIYIEMEAGTTTSGIGYCWINGAILTYSRTPQGGWDYPDRPRIKSHVLTWLTVF